MSLGPLFWTPTVQGLLNYEYVRDNPEQLDDPSWQVGLPQSIIDDIKGSLKKPGPARLLPDHAAAPSDTRAQDLPTL